MVGRYRNRNRTGVHGEVLDGVLRGGPGDRIAADGIADGDGVGAVGLPVPPLEAIYHKRLEPVAVNGIAVAFWQ